MCPIHVREFIRSHLTKWHKYTLLNLICKTSIISIFFLFVYGQLRAVEKQWSTTIDIAADIYHYRSLCQTFNDPNTHTFQILFRTYFFVKIHLSLRIVWIFGEGGERGLISKLTNIKHHIFLSTKTKSKKKKNHQVHKM